MLKGTGDLEASGDYIALAWCPEHDKKLGLSEREAVANHIYVKLGKARRGSRAKEFELFYDMQQSKIIDLGANNNAS